jgi:hypothetical protein
MAIDPKERNLNVDLECQVQLRTARVEALNRSVQNRANGGFHGFSSPAHSCRRFRAAARCALGANLRRLQLGALAPKLVSAGCTGLYTIDEAKHPRGLSLNGFLFPTGGACSKRRCTIRFKPLRTDRTSTPTGLQLVLDYAIGGIHLKGRSFKYN